MHTQLFRESRAVEVGHKCFNKYVCNHLVVTQHCTAVQHCIVIQHKHHANLLCSSRHATLVMQLCILVMQHSSIIVDMQVYTYKVFFISNNTLSLA